MLGSLFNKVAYPQVCNSIKKGVQHRFFPLKFTKLVRTLILRNFYKRLLLVFVSLLSHQLFYQNNFIRADLIGPN